MDMICGVCGKTGIRWMGLLNSLTHTECPHCGSQNCQREELIVDDEPEIATCGCGASGEVNYDDGTELRYYCYSSLHMCSP